MITDRNEAFKHNSCKKLAQLAKVIFSMTAQQRDRNDELRDIAAEYENQIAELVAQHRQKAESIAKSLVQFRKSCIDSSCREYGALYKATKSDLASFYNEQNSKLLDIINQGKTLQKSIYDLMESTLKDANSALDAADNLEKSLKAQQSRPQTATRREITAQIQPILDKITALQSDSDARIQKMRQEHAQEIAKNREEITKFLRAELLKRKSTFDELMRQLKELEKYVSDLRAQHSATVKEHNEFVSKKREECNKIAHDTRHSCRSLKKQINEINEQEKVNSKQRAAQLSEANKALSVAKASHKSQIDSLDKQIHDKRKQRRHFADSKAAELKKQQSALKSVTDGFLKDFEAEVQRRNEAHNVVAACLEDCATDTQRLISLLQQSIDENIERMKNKQIAFRYKLDQQKANETERSRLASEDFKRRCDERIALYESTIADQAKLSHKAQKPERTAVRRLRKELRTLQQTLSDELETARKKSDEEVEAYIQANNSRLEQRKVELQNALDRKQAEKDKRINELKTNFDNDLQTKVSQQEAENKAKVDAFRQDTLVKLSLKKEEEEHELIMKKTKARLEVIQKQIESAEAEGQKRMQSLQNDYSNAEKLQRQLQRRIKTETQQICDEFEMKIQVEQVQLRETIENISKLYDADENQRGCEIIEAVRKVRQTNNRTEDLVKRKERELEDIKKSNNAEIAALQEKVTKLESGEHERLLREELEKKKQKTTAEIAATERANAAKMEEVKTLIAKEKEQHEKAKKELEEQMALDKENYEKELAQIEEEKQKFMKEHQDKIKALDDEYASKKEKQSAAHKVEMDKLDARIAAAKASEPEYREKVEKERRAKEEKIEKELDAKREELHKSNQSVIDQLREKESQLDDRIAELTKKQIDLEMEIATPREKEEEIKEIEKLKSQAKAVLLDIDNLFQDHIKNILDGPDMKFPEEEPTSTGPSTGRSGRSLRTGKESTKSTTNVGTFAFDAKGAHKRAPTLFTPQL